MDHKSFVINFGKHKSKTLEQVYQEDKKYLSWCISNLKNTFVVTKIQEYIAVAAQLPPAPKPVRQTTILNTSPSYTRDYGIKYGELINFTKNTVNKMLTMCGISDQGRNYILDNFPNPNPDLYQATEQYYDNPDTYFHSDMSHELKLDLKKAFLAWRYGIIAEPLKSGSSKDAAVNYQYLLLNATDINDVIAESTAKKNKDEKVNTVNDYRKLSKKLPYLYTPGICQFLMLDINASKMKQIHKANKSNIMSTERGGFPRKGIHTPLFGSVDWEADYFAFLMNPFAYYSIYPSDSTRVLSMTGRNVNNFTYEQYLGTISNFIYNKTKQLKWSATPKWCILQDHPNIDENIKILQANYGIIIDVEKNHLYLAWIYNEEVAVSRFIQQQLGGTTAVKVQEHHMINKIGDMTLTDEQTTAVKSSLESSLSVITGLAGTGKTTVIKAIIKYLTSVNYSFIMCAFTAKARERIIEVIGSGLRDKARTIHSTINYLKSLKKEESETANFPKYIIIDEATMISLSLFSELVEMLIGKDVKVILLGDINQLPPIKYGRPFEDIVESGSVLVSRLTKILRVKGDTTDPIITNSTDIVKSNNYTVTPGSNFQVFTYPDMDVLIPKILQDSNITMDNISNIKFITAMNDDALKLNEIISKLLNKNPDSRLITTELRRKDSNGNKILLKLNYRKGDPIIFTKNGIYTGASNGTEGIIQGFSEDKMMVTVGNNTIEVKLHRNKSTGDYHIYYVLLAYAVTVHKAQGSEWDYEYFYVNGTPNKTFMNKRLVYTGITRAKELCFIIESQEGLYQKAAQTPISIHYGGLQDRICNMKQEDNEEEVNQLEEMMKMMGSGSNSLC